MQSLSSFMNTIRFNFLYIDKYSFGRTWIYPESAIPYNMLRYVIDGSAEFMVDDESVIVKKGQVSYIPCLLYTSVWNRTVPGCTDDVPCR